jgi:hypothetical protein
MSVKRIFISNLEIKNSINEVIINVYVFDKYKLFILNKLKKINNIFLDRLKYKKYKETFSKKLKLGRFVGKYLINGVVIPMFKLCKKVKIKSKKINNFFYNLSLVFSNYSYMDNNILNKLIVNILKSKLRKNYIYKYYMILLYINYIKYNINNLTGLLNIISKIYKKKS